MPRHWCECGDNRLGVYVRQSTRRVGKPTAWGHTHTKREDSYRCIDCRRPLEKPWEGYWRNEKAGGALKAPGPTWKPVVGIPQFEHLWDGASSWSIRITETKEPIGWLFLSPVGHILHAAHDRKAWKTFENLRGALTYLLFVHTTPL